MAFCVLIQHRRVRMGEKLWLACGFLLLLKMGRLTPLFVLIGAPVLAATLPRFSDRVLRRRPVVALLAAVWILGVWRIGRDFPSARTPLDVWLNRNGPTCPGYPIGAAAYVERYVPRVTGRLINELSWGGYLAWRLGDRYQILIDGRTQLYSAEVWEATYLGSEAQRRQFLGAIDVDAAILPIDKSQFRSALLDLGWTSVYRDGWAEVLVPPGANAPGAKPPSVVAGRSAASGPSTPLRGFAPEKPTFPAHTAQYAPEPDNGASETRATAPAPRSQNTNHHPISASRN
jgi:hypothetical protein